MRGREQQGQKATADRQKNRPDPFRVCGAKNRTGPLALFFVGRGQRMATDAPNAQATNLPLVGAAATLRLSFLRWMRLLVHSPSVHLVRCAVGFLQVSMGMDVCSCMRCMHSFTNGFWGGGGRRLGWIGSHLVITRARLGTQFPTACMLCCWRLCFSRDARRDDPCR